MFKHLTPARITLLYAMFAALWIYASDKLLALAVHDPELFTRISIDKGFIFILVTAFLLYTMVRKLVSQTSDTDKQLQLFYDLPFIGMSITSPDSKAWLYVNDYLCNMLGYSREELLQSTWSDLTEQDDLDTSVKQLERMKAGEIEGYELEKRYIRKDGTPLTTNLSVRCARGKDGKIIYVVALIEDITERKQTELALRASEATYRSLFDNILNGVSHCRMIYRNDLPVDYEFIAVNPAFESMTGLQNVVGRKISEVIPGYCEENPESLEIFGRVAETRKATRWEHYLGAAGKWFSFSIYSPAPGEFVAVTDDITEGKRAELALRKSEATYRSLFDNMLNGVAHYRMIFLDGVPVDYEFISVNPAFVQTTGLTDVVGKKVSEVIPGYCEANQDSLRIFGEVVQTGKPVRWEHYLAALGKWFSFSIYSPAQGEFVVVNEDITERKQSETALQKNEQALLEAQEIGGFGNYDYDIANDSWTSSPVMDRIFGIDENYPRTATGWGGIIHPLQRDAMLNYLSGIFEQHLVFDKEYRIIRQNDGKERWVHGLGKVTYGSDGAPLHLTGTIQDVTERKQTEDTLHQAATVFESSHDGVVITDLNGRMLAVNRAFLKITGYAEAEVIGRNPNILHSGRQKKDFYQSMWRGIKAEGFWQGEIWNRRKNGEIYPEWLTISAVYNDEGEATRYVGVFSDLSQLKQSETQLEHLAHYDPLTNLPNRLLLQSHLAHALVQGQRHHTQVGVLYLDLDRFKNINDSLGYPVGDELLTVLTKRLATRMRAEDMLARLGGDEFLLVLEDIEGPEHAATMARAMLGLLAQPFELSGTQEVYIGASIGISISPDDGSSANELIQHADAAMHLAKKHGRNTYRFYTEALTRSAGEHLELENRLRHAINAEQLRVYYQPQVDIATGHIIGAEALVRWLDPERGLIQPAQFIRLAEETGLIGAIGEWVLRETCLQGVRWIKAGLPFLTLAVNLSPHQFMRGNIAELVSKLLAETGFPADRLELEITESALMDQEEEAVKMLHLLRAQDIRLAIDDFGTGYSSLSYLKRFPLDILKIDKSFVDDIPFHQDDMEIAATIIAMGHILGFKVMAEGVETAEQLAFLQSKGCDMYQGYFTSPPVPAEEFEKLLATKMQRVK